MLTTWRATGLVPYNPLLVLQKLNIRQSVLRKTDSIITTTITTTTTTTTITTTTTTTTNITSSHPITPTTLQNFHEIEKTPANIDQINQLIRRIRNDEESDSTPVQALIKFIKGAKYAFAESNLLRITNNELLQAIVRRHHRANRSKAHYRVKARVLSLEDDQQ